MEPVTHFLTGAVIGRSGLNRKSAYATLAAVLAAEAADIDIFWGFAGPVENLKHHRGFTHTFWAAPLLAAAVVLLVWAIDTIVRRRTSSSTRQPIRWTWLYASALISALGHLFLDWTNNYGLRPFFPFNPHWYAGSFVYIYEPLFWAILLLALMAPALANLIGGEIGARRTPFPGRGGAIFALCAMTILWGWRWSEHARALALIEAAPITQQTVLRIAAQPYPINPFRWRILVETPLAFQSAEVNTRTASIESDPRFNLLYKPNVTPALQAATSTLLGQVYRDWGAWAVLRDLGPVPIPALPAPQLPPGRRWTTIDFSDLRFDDTRTGGPPSLRRAPLGGQVYIVDDHEEAGMVLGGHIQH